MRRLCILTLLLSALSTTGCAGALRHELEAKPFGTFSGSRDEALLVQGAVPLHEASPAMPQNTGAGGGRPLFIEQSRAALLTALGFKGLDDEEKEALLACDWSPPERLEIAQAREVFLLRSSAIEAILKRHQASFTSYDQIDALNDLARQYASFAEGLETSASTPHVRPGKPSWPLRGADRMEHAIAEIDVEISRVRSVEEVYQELVRLEEAFQDGLYWSQAAKTYQRNVRQARQAYEVAESLYQGGQGHYLYVLFAENRVDLLRAELSSAREQALASKVLLAALLEIPYEGLEEIELVPSPAPERPSQEEVEEWVLSQGPAIQAASLEAARATLMVEWIERQILPEISAELHSSREAEAKKRSSDRVYATHAPFLAELVLVEEAAQQVLEGATSTRSAEAILLWASLSASLREWELASGASARRARQAKEAASDAFRAAEISFFELDDAITRALEVDLSAHLHQRDAAIAAVKLEAAMGGMP